MSEKPNNDGMVKVDEKLPCVPVAAVEKFIGIAVEDMETLESKIVVLKTRIAKRTISEASIIRELDEMLTTVRK